MRTHCSDGRLTQKLDQCIILFSFNGGESESESESESGGDSDIVMPPIRSGVIYRYLNTKRPRVRSFWDLIFESGLYDGSNICLSLGPEFFSYAPLEHGAIPLI